MIYCRECPQSEYQEGTFHQYLGESTSYSCLYCRKLKCTMGVSSTVPDECKEQNSFELNCPKCGENFEASEENINIGGEVPSETCIFIECPFCKYEQQI